jgi:hypothetical protein
VHQEPPEVAWPEPELEPGPDDGLPRPLELPELAELELDEPELALPELALPELPLDEFVPVEALLDELGRVSATAPAASTLATPTVAVVATTRPLARRRAATARATASRFGLFMS